MRIRLSAASDDQLRKLIARMETDSISEFLSSQADNLVATIRSNITRMGRLESSEWPPLSKAYARRKRTGKTPGRGKNKVTMLKDTGALYDSLVGRVEMTETGPRLVLDAVGGKRGISHSELLQVHAFGEGRMPARHPGLPEHMGLFMTRLERSLGKWLKV